MCNCFSYLRLIYVLSYLISSRILENERAEICCYLTANFKMLKIRGFLRPMCRQA